MSRRRIQGGTAGIVSAIVAGVLDPLSGEIVDRGRRWPTGRRNWYEKARREREEHWEARGSTRASRLPEAIIWTPEPLADAPPF